MSNQGTIRLKVTNGAPAIEKLWNGRFKLEFLCDNNSPKEDWYYDNISSILPDYGILQETNFGSGVSEDWEAIPDSVYPNMRLVETEYVFIPSMGDKRVKLTYETLTAAWVEEKDEDTDYELNGLKRVSRTFVALPDTTYDKVVGTSTIDSNGTTLYLGSFKIEETDAKWSLSEIWLEAGELSREENSEDAKGSISISQIGGCPAAPAGYTVVNESKNNTQGFETCSRTFYKDDSELSRSNDYVGSQLAESIEVFSPTVAPTPTNGTAVLGNKSTSNVDGIPTIRYTFLVPSVLSESSDKVGSQLAITVEAFNETPATPTGYVIANKQTSDVEGIPTTRYTFLKPSVLSKSLDKIGSQLAITIDAFGEIPVAPAGYVLANERVSDLEGIATNRYTFLRPSILSQSEDKVGSQLAITIEAFNEVPATPAGYFIASTQESDVDGIPTKRYTFLKPSILSQSEDKVGGQLAIIVEAFNEVPLTPVGYVIANEQTSNVEGIPTTRYTFLKPGILSLSENYTDSSGTETGVAFDMTDAEIQAAIGLAGYGYLLIESTLSDYNGIQTTSFTYQKALSSDVIDYDLNGLMRLTTVSRGSANPLYGQEIGVSSITMPVSQGGKTLYLANLKIVDSEIKEETYVWIEPGIIDETQKTIDAGLLQISRVSFKDENVPLTGVVVSKKQQNYNGYPVWATVTIQLRDGTDPTSAVASEHSIFVPFKYPGVANVSENLITSGSFQYYGYTSTAYDVQLISPVTADIEATVTISYQTLDEIGILPFPFWSPKTWATVESSWSWVSDYSYAQTSGGPSVGGKSLIGSKYKGLPGYRVGDVASVSYVGEYNGYIGYGIRELATFFGQTVVPSTSGGDWDASGSINIIGGPENPENNSYVIQKPVLEEAFSDIDGTQYYRKVIITATIPPQI